MIMPAELIIMISWSSVTLAAAVLDLELREICSLAHSQFGSKQEGVSLRIDLHTDDFIVRIQIHTDDAHRRSSKRSYIFLPESDAHALLSNKENIIFRSGLLDFDQLIIFSEIDRNDTASADIRVFRDRSLLDDSFLRHHEEIGLFIIVKNRYDRGDLLSRIQFQKIDDRRTSRSAAGFRNLISLHAVDTAKTREEHDHIMGPRHQKIFDIIIVNLLDALNAASAAVLDLEVIHGHSLDITKRSHRDDRIDIGNQVLRSYFGKILIDLASSVVAELLSYDTDLILDDKKKFVVIRKDRFKFGDPGKKFLMLLLQLLSFQTCQSAQTHVYDHG